MNPKVSVLMPAFNAARYVEAAIDSVLGQTYHDFELILLDDGSMDETWRIFERYVARDPRISIHRNDRNQDIAACRNQLVHLAKGEYLMWQDADDISMPQRMEQQVQALDADRAIGIVGGQVVVLIEASGKQWLKSFPLEDSILRRKIFRYMPVAQPAAMIRKSILDTVGDYDPYYTPSEDLDMIFRIGEKSKLANLATRVLVYREHSQSATSQRLKRIDLCTVSIRTRYAGSAAYAMNWADHTYNIGQYASAFLLPGRLKIWLFQRFRYTPLKHPA